MIDLIRNRILKVEPLDYLTRGSTAVVSFGDFTQSKIATLSINPSSREFLSGKSLIKAPGKRLVDKEVLGLNIDQKIRDEHWESIWEGCKNYFSPAGNPYYWFDDLQIVLHYLQANYRDNSACHLDLVQWATSPSWKLIPIETQRALLRSDTEFFNAQTNSRNLEMLIVNGVQVFDVISRMPGFEMRKVDPIFYWYKGRSVPNYRFTGTGSNGKRVIGWTGTLRNMRVDTSTRIAHCHELGEWISNEL